MARIKGANSHSNPSNKMMDCKRSPKKGSTCSGSNKNDTILLLFMVLILVLGGLVYNARSTVEIHYKNTQLYFIPKDNSSSSSSSNRTSFIPKDNNSSSSNRTSFIPKDNNSSSSSSNNRTTLILHVGPLKTGTTFLQTAALPKLKKELEQNGIRNIDNFNYLQMGKLITDCFGISTTDINSDKCNATWGRLLYLFDEASKLPNTTAIVHSVESYSSLPDNQLVINELRKLLQTFTIRVVIMYRSSHRWYISRYKQYLKYGLYLSRSGRWREYPAPKTVAPPSMPQWLQDIIRKEYDQQQQEQEQHQPREKSDPIRDTLATYQFYSKIFGQDAEIILQDMTVDNFEIPFICDAIRSPIACEQVKKKSKWRNTRSNDISFLLDEDSVIIEAYRQNNNIGGLWQQQGRGNNNKHLVDLDLVTRHEATKRLHVLFNNTIATAAAATIGDSSENTLLPMDCLSKEQIDWLWSRTKKGKDMLLAATTMSSSSLMNPVVSNSSSTTKTTTTESDELLMMDDFKRNLGRYCSINPKKLLQNQSWVDLLNNCVFPKIPLLNCSTT
jgi:hypothetical protein